MSKKSQMMASLVALIMILIVVSFCYPAWLDNRNLFLREYIYHGFLPTLGVIVPITLTFIAKMHIQLNLWEKEKEPPEELEKIRLELKESANYMIISLALALFIGIVKGLLPIYGVATLFDLYGLPVSLHYHAWLNSVAILIFFLNLLVLRDIVGASTKILH